jgi:hypothetical protein
VTISAAGTYDEIDVAVFRLGWSDGMAGALCGHQLGVRSSSALAAVADFATTGWTSGLYVAVATPAGRPTPHRAAPFVVCDPTSDASIVMQVPFFTYQAYNAWGGSSLYDFNTPGGRAASVDLGRPFDGFDGAGFLYYGDWQLAAWLERHGYPVAYVSSMDTHRDSSMMDGRRLFVSAFHDEYWSVAMRRNLEGWLAAGVNAAFFGANSIYWQVDPQVDGERAVLHCDKVFGGPQGTFRSADAPEHLLLGSQYEAYQFPYGTAAADWVVTNADHWIYRGTALRNSDRIERLVGYEWDRLPGDQPGPGVTPVADSPIGDRHHHHAAVVEHQGGGAVFNAGTTYWPRLLLGGSHWPAHPAVGTMTHNLMDALGR